MNDYEPSFSTLWCLVTHYINNTFSLKSIFTRKTIYFSIRFKIKKMPVEDNDNNNTNNKNDDNNTDNKHSNPVTVIVKRIAKKIKSKNLKNGFQEFLRKSLNKKAIWELIQLDQLTNLNLNMLSYLGRSEE